MPQYAEPGAYGYGYGYEYGYGAQHVRGGHPEQREPGGGWGAAPYTAAPQETGPQRRIAQGPPRVPGPRREFVEAFDADSSQAEVEQPDSVRVGGDDDAADGDRKRGMGGMGRTFTGISAAAVTTVLAIVVAGQVTDTGTQDDRAAQSADAPERSTGDAASRSDQRPTPPQGAAPSAPPPASSPSAPGATPSQRPPTYEQLMARQFPIDPKLKGSGDFEAVPGADPAPGKGEKIRYRVDVEKGLGLDGKLFADAVQKTLNDDRSWAHGGVMTFERISSGQADFVITLASPGTTGVWCAKSGLDTTVDNVSCDSAATQRIMINAYRWAQGAETYGADAMLAYRQMLINHEVGHRLGHNHETCRKQGALAPVMQQQTKTLEIDGITCRPNPWVYPAG